VAAAAGPFGVLGGSCMVFERIHAARWQLLHAEAAVQRAISRCWFLAVAEWCPCAYGILGAVLCRMCVL
jgi:hypothetical protein